MIRKRIRLMFDAASEKLGLLQLGERRMRGGLTILMYHRVLRTEDCFKYPLDSLVIPANAFASQMQWLARNCTVLPLAEALAQLLHGPPADKPLVSVTFDDGYSDNFELAAPILDQFGLKATFFVASGFVESKEPFWFDFASATWRGISDRHQLDLLNEAGSLQKSHSPYVATRTVCVRLWMESLKRLTVPARDSLITKAMTLSSKQFDTQLYRPLTPGQLAELHTQHHEIAAHTVTHPILTNVDNEHLHAELVNSRAQLENWIGAPVTGFCYPNGSFDERVEQAVKDVGYMYACTTSSGMNRASQSHMQLSRLAITMQRTVQIDGSADIRGFRAELSRLREWLR